ncbi:MAG: acyl-CoA thioesterase [Cyclobacteriaceae bacterium]|nr:acyl-CoA thioesterase [Cyclobacteriaceae bacterium]
MLEIPKDRGVFRLAIQVQPEDIDDQNHVNNVVYLRWVQEVAYAHWKTLGSDELISKYRWVVLRHEIDYHSPALLSDTIEAFTWIDAPEGPRQKRNVSIRRIHDQKILASATTTWCLLDAVTGRPKRVTEEITSVFGLKE